MLFRSKFLSCHSRLSHPHPFSWSHKASQRQRPPWLGSNHSRVRRPAIQCPPTGLLHFHPTPPRVVPSSRNTSHCHLEINTILLHHGPLTCLLPSKFPPKPHLLVSTSSLNPSPHSAPEGLVPMPPPVSSWAFPGPQLGLSLCPHHKALVLTDEV